MNKKSRIEHQPTFVDLFAGIGGIRLAFEQAGGVCCFTSEFDRYARQTYLANFRNIDDHSFAGDITQVNERDVPIHDVLVAGFPCQPFSIAGVSKKNSLDRPHGFADETQGTLFFDIARIVAKRRPKAIFLENVKHLLSHDKGHTFAVIQRVLENELGYNLSFEVFDSRAWVPQGRQRVLIVGLDAKRYGRGAKFEFERVRRPRNHPTLRDILHPENGSETAEEPYTFGHQAKVAAKYTLSSDLWAYLKKYAEKHRRAGHGFGYGLVNGSSVTRTLSARYYKDGSEILVDRGKSKNPRRLTPRECARLMGFPEKFVIPVSDVQAYRQFGNSVVVPMVKSVALSLFEQLDELDSASKSKSRLQIPTKKVS